MSIVRIFTTPVDIEINCLHCDHEIEMFYSDFENLMPSDYPGDWNGEVIVCPYCGKEIEIEESSWD
ncbi:hypothetical protein [Clostridium perfringens]|uniref:hypothetical protein n=1 Tax=Clostridium perfringens TaxID=1502 RepID=UPI002342041E|nr:hypothetical protein [Clostridium perfringens]MDC4245672.1 phage terminase large subunit family protein [Clostridium perfringens]